MNIEIRTERIGAMALIIQKNLLLDFLTEYSAMLVRSFILYSVYFDEIIITLRFDAVKGLIFIFGCGKITV